MYLYHLEPECIEQQPLALAIRLLADDERERLASISHPGRRAEFAWGRLLVRSALQHRYGLAAGDWRFSLRPSGRPMIHAPMSSLRFSLAHCQGLIGCLLGDADPVGLDLEDTQRQLDHLALAQRFFAPDEHARIAALDQRSGRELFFDSWTAKEARAKALELPLAQALQTPPAPPLCLYTLDARWRIACTGAVLEALWLAPAGSTRAAALLPRPLPTC